MLRKYLGIKKKTRMELILILLWLINSGLIVAHYLYDDPFPVYLLVISTIITVVISKRIRSHYYN